MPVIFWLWEWLGTIRIGVADFLLDIPFFHKSFSFGGIGPLRLMPLFYDGGVRVKRKDDAVYD